MNLGKRSKHSTRLGRLLLCALFACLATNLARAVDPNNHISQYAHTAWRVQDGVFNIPTAITQTTDGYIWFGTQSGLTRFDGIRFVPWNPPDGGQLMSPRIDSLLGASDGSLWIGTAGGLSHWHDNHLTNYVDEPGVVVSIIESRAGSVWIAMTHSIVLTQATAEDAPLCQIIGTGMRCHGKDEGIPANVDSTMTEDSRGDFWIGGATSLVRWNPQTHSIYNPSGLKSNAGMLGMASLAPSPDGSLWVGIASSGPGLGLQQLVQGIWKPFISSELKGDSVAVEQLLLDRENALWIGTSQHGIYRIYGGRVEHCGTADGLSSDNVRRFFEDREGNLWVITTRGIDNFRNVPVVSFSTHEGLSTTEVDSVFASRNGSVWIGGYEALDVLRGPASTIVGKHLPGKQITSLFEDHQGRLWVGIDDTLTIYKDGTFRRINRRNGNPIGMVVGITEDVDGDIWVESRGTPMTLIRIRDFEDQAEFTSPQMPAARRVGPDPHGGLWLGLMNGDLARYQHGRTEIFHYQHTPDSRVEQVSVGPDGSVLGATAFGLVGWTRGKQVTLTMRNGLPCDSVYAFASDDSGDLWLNTQCGIAEIPNAELRKWWENSDAMLQIKVFDVFDGAQPGRAPFVSAAKSSDGRLWFADGMVLQMVDPNHLGGNSMPPPVHIEGMVADRKSYPPQDGLSLPPLTRDLEVDYTGLSFVAPQKVRFRYKLEGRDTGWQDPGIRRQAFYTDLRPGQYTFRVIACNNDGIWNEDGATLDFTVAAAWYQTVWFRLVCVASFLLLLWALFRFRIHQLARQFNTTVETRVAERTRIARDLHDTLLQSLHGLMFRFQAARNMLPRRPEEAMQALDGAITRTEQAIAESRDAIKDLRSDSSAQTDLAELLTEISKELVASYDTNGDPPNFSVTVEGERRTISPIVQEEVCQIAREVLRNASRHAKAHQIEAEVRYDRRVLRLRFRDDGTGIDPKILKEGGRAGHWGLPGIRERAQRIRARLDFWSEAGAGTEIQLTIPAVAAYETSRQGSRFGIFSKARRP